MTTTITMPAEITNALAKACQEAVEQAVSALAVRYEFDAEEAMEHLGSGLVNIQHKRGPAKAEKPVTRSATKSPDRPKRAKTGYLMFADSARAEVREGLEQTMICGVKLQPKAVVTEIARLWKALEEEEREVWKARAAGVASDC
jgi:hypothetical protein